MFYFHSEAFTTTNTPLLVLTCVALARVQGGHARQARAQQRGELGPRHLERDEQRVVDLNSQL